MMASATCTMNLESGICFLMVALSQFAHVSSRDTECSVTIVNNERLPCSCTYYKFTVKEFKQLCLVVVQAKNLFPLPWFGTGQLHMSSLSWLLYYAFLWFVLYSRQVSSFVTVLALGARGCEFESR